MIDEEQIFSILGFDMPKLEFEGILTRILFMQAV